MKTLPNIFFLRFLLATLVVIYHIPETSHRLGFPSFRALPIFDKGSLAVYYFFTVSGFLVIRNLYLENENKGMIDIKKFYLRRIGRLWPVYFVVITIGVILYHFLLPLFEIPFETNYSLSKLLLYYLAFIPNIFNEIYKVGGVLNIVWSIGIEEQFYLVAPVILYIFRSKIVLTLSLILAALLITLFVYPEFYKYSNFYFYFASGGLMAILCEKKIFNLSGTFINAALVLLFAVSFVTDVFDFTNKPLFHLFHMALSALVICSIAYFPIFKVQNKKLNYLGEISYGIYMYHMIVVVGYFFILNKLNMKIIFNDTLSIVFNNLIILSITFIVSHLSHKYFESLFYKKHIKETIVETKEIEEQKFKATA